ncbi:MAG TPA: hypothetical protein DET40_25945 [Lentisphaeria bacterium]|nr:MAG: hypothetical protein A2X45_15035 [Lentisphaerae bacterium GWF2_50_93]HCE47005.1 hypothetical protein [Lentisphaeria bacterium]
MRKKNLPAGVPAVRKEHGTPAPLPASVEKWERERLPAGVPAVRKKNLPAEVPAVRKGKEYMTLENRRKIVKLISLVVGLAGVMVMIGWIFDIEILKSLSPSWISMKFDTALSFFLSGLTLYFIARAQEGEFDRAQVVISITSLVIILLMGILFFSTVFGVMTGAEHLFVREEAGGVKTVIPGLPSIPTMFSFILMAMAGVLTILRIRRLHVSLMIIGLILAAVGISAITGYVIDFPALYYYIATVNSAMAFHTAVLLALLGIGLICLYE